MGDIASLVQLSVNSVTQGTFLVARAQNWSVKSTKKAEENQEVGNPDGAGVTRKPGGYVVTFEVLMEKGNTTMLSKWRGMLDSQEWFAITKQIVGGARDQHPQCQVSSIDEDGDNAGSNKFSVEVISLTRKGM